MNSLHQSQTTPLRVFLGLRWKVLLGASLALIPILAFLTLYARTSLINQFELHQSHLRHHQANHLLTLITERYEQMSRIANLIPSLSTQQPVDHEEDPGHGAGIDHSSSASPSQFANLGERFSQALQTEGSLLDLEWDIRSIHWIPIGGEPTALWPTPNELLPAQLVIETRHKTDRVTEHLMCDKTLCRQYVSSPILWRGETAGNLLLGRSISSILVAFRALTGVDLAIANLSSPDPNAPELHFHGATQPQTVLPLIESLPAADLLASSTLEPLKMKLGQDWYEIFRIDPGGKGLTAFVINQTTTEQLGIRNMARNSLLIGLIGLLVAVVLLMLILRGPVERIRRLSNLLPLLAENRFETLAERLPRTPGPLRWQDEIDNTITVFRTLNERMARMQTERESAQQELRWLADHDPLTALMNRRRFDSELNRAINQALRLGTQGALLFIDLDNFKDVNDTNGHQIGDRLLKRISKRLTSTLGQQGQIGRFGGDEFAVLLHTVDDIELRKLVAQLQQQISGTSVRAGNHRHQVSASIGIALFPEHGTDTQALMANADLAMYQAKTQQRRGNWHLYSNDDLARDQANARVLWTREMSKAMNEGRLQLYFQPIMALPDRRIWRAEGLLRMQLSNGRQANPGEFIPVAERTGFINLIDRWVLAEAIRVLASHPQLALAINLSAKALADPSLDAELIQLLKHSGIDPHRLTLEITETVAIDNVDAAVARMNSIRALGCRFALDDFGSGFASYSYLKQLPVDDVKIDGSFIRNLDHNPEDRIFVKAAVEMAHAMGKRVIAEFVESEAILNVLGELGVDFAQGYFIGRPVPELPATDRGSSQA